MRGTCVALLLAVASCATVEQHNASSRAIGSDGFVSVGDVVLRVEVTEDLPPTCLVATVVEALAS